jgi:hypothetical protein
MKHMGVSAEHSGHDQATRDRLNHEANERYAAKHGVRNKDQNGGNFVYRQHNGEHRAEIIDWARTEHLGTHPKVPAPHMEQVHAPAKRKCSGCVTQ